MKNIALIFLLSIMFFSCKKDVKFPDNPDWLTAKISEMETPVYYVGTTVYAYEWNKDYYYLISIGLSSCAMCEFYNYQGEKVEWTDEKMLDFQKNGKKIQVIWQRFP
jgi:hypothetical protein